MTRPLALGAVLYDPKVSVIWEIICGFFEEHGIQMDVVYFATYERQVDALARGLLDVAWNSPLAWLDTHRRTGPEFRAVAMRDTDRDRRTHFVVKRGTGLAQIADLRDKTLAVGAMDSPQATMIPIEVLRANGLEAGRDYQVERFDVLVGKHGDHIGGELDAFKALKRGTAVASTMLDLNWQAWTRDGTINANEYEIMATTGAFDHCVFAMRAALPEDVTAKWLGVLFSMSYDNPKHRQMMDMEGLKAWVPGRTTGFELLTRAVDHQHFFARS